MFYRISVLALLLLAVAAGVHAEVFDDDEILVRLQPGVLIGDINTDYNTTTVEELVPGVTYKVVVADPALLASTLAAMQNDPRLVWSENNYFGESPEASRRTLAVVDSTPTESEYLDQAAMQRIHAADAQRYSTGAGVLVAVIDTGVDYNHPDLTNHVLRDPTTNTVIGWDFVDNDADPLDATVGIGAGHGTHVAGIIALVAPDAKIVPIRVLNSDGVGTAEHVAQAIRYVVHNLPGDKKVINLSLGIPNIDRVEAIHDVIDEEIVEAGLPISIIASAGNDGLPVVHYPAREGDVLSIAAVDSTDKKADFSNYKYVDVSAPGVGIYSTYLNGQYATWDGTSMAAPFVTGEVALVRAIEGGAPRSVEAMESLVEAAVDNISKQNPGVDVGSGRINLLKAVQDGGGITIKKVVYVVDRMKLVVKVRSDAAPGDVLQVEGFGSMKYDPVKKLYYLIVKKLMPMPESVTISSFASSSSITVPVQPK